MSLRPAHDLTLDYGDNTVSLRPSLRAASLLERAYTFEVLFNQVDQFHLGTIRDIIKTAATDRQEAAAFLDAIANAPLNDLVDALHGPITNLCRAFILPPDNDGKPSSGKPMTWQEVYRELYRTAAGWLGWTPETAWSATPYEINEASAGHFAMLKAIHGSADDKDKQTDNYSADDLKQIDDLGYDPAFDRDAFKVLQSQIPGGA